MLCVFHGVWGEWWGGEASARPAAGRALWRVLAPVRGHPMYQHPILCLSGQRLGDGPACGHERRGLGAMEMDSISFALLDGEGVSLR